MIMLIKRIESFIFAQPTGFHFSCPTGNNWIPHHLMWPSYPLIQKQWELNPQQINLYLQPEWQESHQTKFVNQIMLKKCLCHICAAMNLDIAPFWRLELPHLIHIVQKGRILPVRVNQANGQNILGDIIDSRSHFRMLWPVSFLNLKCIFSQKNICRPHPFLHDRSEHFICISQIRDSPVTLFKVAG